MGVREYCLIFDVQSTQRNKNLKRRNVQECPDSIMLGFCCLEENIPTPRNVVIKVVSTGISGLTEKIYAHFFVSLAEAIPVSDKKQTTSS